MNNKQLLKESEIRRFMKLANLEPLTKNVLKESSHAEEYASGKAEAVNNRGPVMQSEAEEPMDEPADDKSMDEPADDDSMGDEPADDAGGEGDTLVSPEVAQGAIQALAEYFGYDTDVQMGGADAGEEGGMEDEEQGEYGEGGMEELEEAAKAKSAAGTAAEEGEEGEEGKKGKKGEKQTTASKQNETLELSEDDLVETVLARVTARLVEAAKAKKKKGAAAEMEKKKKEAEMKKKKATMKEATDAKNGGPLLSKGGNKYDVYKGHASMEYGKGEKGGKGGHALEKVTAKAEHTVTHGGKNLATLGGNKS